MKKLVFSTMLVFTLLLSTIGFVGAISWSTTQSFKIPSFGAWSTPSSAAKSKTKACSYGYMEAIKDTSSLSKYGDFVKSGTTTRATKSYYKIHVNNLTKMHYTTTNTKSKSLSVKARASGENFEPSAGTVITAKFSADN